MTMDDVTRELLLSRRRFLTSSASGFGALALASLLAENGLADPAPGKGVTAGPSSVQPPHHPATAKAGIFIFLAGGPSQVDLWDPKPLLAEHEGEALPASVVKGRRFAFIGQKARLKPSPYRFQKYGQCGMDFSEHLPHLATCADDLTMIRSMMTDTFNHLPGHIMMNTGFLRFGHPSVGAWVLYGLGSESSNLPGYVVLTSAGTVRGGGANWSNGFLPPRYQGVHFRSQGDPVLNLSNPQGIDAQVQRRSLEAINQLNHWRYGIQRDPEITSRIAAYELAFGMQAAAPELIDLSAETQQTLRDYGVLEEDAAREAGTAGGRGSPPQFARSCLLARRLVERGVRFVTIFHGEWDHHSGIHRGLTRNCPQIDRPLAALIQDLKRRGLLESTVVVCTGEFGRTCLGQGEDGRDHHPYAFTSLLAGGGVRGGLTYGRTDDFGFDVVENPVHVHDFHATLLHLFGLDHLRLTYRSQGRDMRLTDVAGTVVRGILA
jgi:hypothetical protein